MADFAWRAIDTGGRERHGRMQAPTLDDARARLQARRFYVVAVDKAGDGPGPSLASNLLRRRPRLNVRELTLFTRQFATLVRVMPIEEALRSIAGQTARPRAVAVIEAVHGSVLAGRRLADALAVEAPSFPPLYRAMVAAGEASGTLPAILARLADLHERQAEVRNKLVTALAYPAALALVAAGVVLALMLFVVPKIVGQFETVGQQLPLLTRIVIDTSHVIGHWWWAMLLALAAAVLIFVRMMADPGRRLALDTWVLRLPLVGRLVRDLHAARMARTLAKMVESRLPLVEGIAMVSPTLRNHALRRATDRIVEDIRGGASLSASMRRSGLFPAILVHMAASGEAAGRIDEMLEHAADYLEREFDMFTATMLSLLEPAVIVVMGAIVAVIILSILLPVLQLDTLAGLS
jgi:general secretion pathway protein F